MAFLPKRVAASKRPARVVLYCPFDKISAQPQVRSLVWFLDYDGSGDRRWDAFSLSTGFGQMYEAARDFDALLAGE